MRQSIHIKLFILANLLSSFLKHSSGLSTYGQYFGVSTPEILYSIKTTAAYSLIDCSSMCSTTAGCNVFTYDKGSGACELFETQFIPDRALSEIIHTKEYYIKQKEYCDAGWDVYAGSCYLINTTMTFTWQECKEHCQYYDSLIMEITSKVENEFAYGLIRSSGVTDDVWLGANDIETEGRFVWPSGERLVYSNFSIGEPNDTFGKEDCVKVFYYNALWNDDDCDTTIYCVCVKNAMFT